MPDALDLQATPARIRVAADAACVDVSRALEIAGASPSAQAWRRFLGLVLLLRMGHEENSGRGGNWTDRWDRVRAMFARRRQPRICRAALGLHDPGGVIV